MKRLWLRKKNTPPPCGRILPAVDICQPEEEQQIGRHRFEIAHHLGSPTRHPGCNCTTGAPWARPPILGMCQPLARSRHKSARGACLHLRAVQNGSGDGGVPEVQGIPLAISGRQKVENARIPTPRSGPCPPYPQGGRAGKYSLSVVNRFANLTCLHTRSEEGNVGCEGCGEGVGGDGGGMVVMVVVACMGWRQREQQRQ